MLNKLKGEKDMSEKEKRIKPSEMREFWIGIILLAVGLFMLSMKVSVHTGWGGFYIGFFPVTSNAKLSSNSNIGVSCVLSKTS